jgi:hypothetical protein
MLAYAGKLRQARKFASLSASTEVSAVRS